MKHFYKKIPGWFSYRGLYEQAVKEAPDPALFVEVGCWKGRSSAFMAVEIIKSNKKIRFVCVDTWLGSNEVKHKNDPSVQNGRLFDDFLKNIKPVAHVIVPYRRPSVEAAATYRDESIDFVMIDAAHDYKNVLADIAAWWPKIKVGGVMAGDDYLFRGVERAVRVFFLGSFIIENVKGSGHGQSWKIRKILRSLSGAR